jgi:hypothetical protein
LSLCAVTMHVTTWRLKKKDTLKKEKKKKSDLHKISVNKNNKVKAILCQVIGRKRHN